MENTLAEYWHRFQKLHPRHEIFRTASERQVKLCRTIPVYSHVDEGRTYRSKALLLFSVHGALGTGTRSYNRRMGVRRVHIKADRMKLNFTGNTWGNQFLVFSLAREAFSDNPASLDLLLSTVAGDMKYLATHGTTSSSDTTGSKRLWVLHLGVKGDLPALAKVGHLQRCFTRMPRFGNARANCVGICWLCRAGQESPDEDQNIPFEDFGGNAKWKTTVLDPATPPWQVLPAILYGLPCVPGEEPACLKTDFWHNWHNGLGKSWLASSFVVMNTLGVLHGASVDSKFEDLSNEYILWARHARITPYLRHLSRETFAFETMTSSPNGVWSKAEVTTQLMLFLSALCESRIDGRTDDPILLAIVFRLQL